MRPGRRPPNTRRTPARHVSCSRSSTGGRRRPSSDRRPWTRRSSCASTSAARSPAVRLPSRRRSTRSRRSKRCAASSTGRASCSRRGTLSSKSSAGSIRRPSRITSRSSRCSPDDPTSPRNDYDGHMHGSRKWVGASSPRPRQRSPRLEEMGGRDLLATTAAMLAQALLAQDRPEEALHFCEVSRKAAAPEDLWSQVDGAGAYAKILARRGGEGEAETLAREAVELAASTDFLTLRGAAFLDLAEVLEVGGQAAGAVDALSAGLELYEQKGDLVSAK